MHYSRNLYSFCSHFTHVDHTGVAVAGDMECTGSSCSPPNPLTAKLSTPPCLFPPNPRTCVGFHVSLASSTSSLTALCHTQETSLPQVVNSSTLHSCTRSLSLHALVFASLLIALLFSLISPPSSLHPPPFLFLSRFARSHSINSQASSSGGGTWTAKAAAALHPTHPQAAKSAAAYSLLSSSLLAGLGEGRGGQHRHYTALLPCGCAGGSGGRGGGQHSTRLGRDERASGLGRLKQGHLASSEDCSGASAALCSLSHNQLMAPPCSRLANSLLALALSPFLPSLPTDQLCVCALQVEGRGGGQHRRFLTPLPCGRAVACGDGREAALPVAATKESIGATGHREKTVAEKLSSRPAAAVVAAEAAAAAAAAVGGNMALCMAVVTLSGAASSRDVPCGSGCGGWNLRGTALGAQLGAHDELHWGGDGGERQWGLQWHMMSRMALMPPVA
ncbi:unnamed protein product [Closterium sp. NIES-64]|nr:unnamed protein product [Closterium sp. NIES-64]